MRCGAVRSKMPGGQRPHSAARREPRHQGPEPSSRRRSHRTGSTVRTGPSGASGDSATATTAASSDPIRIDTSKPIRLSSTVSEGWRQGRGECRAHHDPPGTAARSTGRRSEARRGARSAPKTPSAMEIGFSERSALATTGASAWSVAITPVGMRAVTSRSTAGTARGTTLRLDPEDEGAGELLPLPRQQLPGKRRRQGDERGEGVDVVLHDLRVQRRQPDDLQIDSQSRRNGARPEAGQVLLGVRVEPVRDDLADVETKLLCDLRCHHDLIGSGRRRHAALGDGDSVLGEEQAVDAGHGIRLAGDP